MSERDELVSVPEYALGEERIAFGLTAVQLAILVAAGLLVAALNLLPLWPPLRLGLIVLLAGPPAAAAVLRYRDAPAYVWLLRLIRFRRSSRSWQPRIVDAAAEAASKRLVSSDVEDVLMVMPGPRTNDAAPVPAGTTFDVVEGGAERSGADNEPAAAVEVAAPSAPQVPAAPGTAVTPGEPMDGKIIRLWPEQPDRPELDSELAPPGDDVEASPPPLPYVFPLPRLVCLVSFAGGVGKTALAIEVATYLAAHARYRSGDASAHAIEVLLVDAARLAPALGLRLGLAARSLAEAWRWVDRDDPGAVAATVRPLGTHLSLLTLPPDPTFTGGEPGAPPEAAFSAGAADVTIDAARRAGAVLAIADLGTRLEAGHVRLIEQAELVIGVVRPTVESLPDVYRLSEWLRRLGAGRKLAIAANGCADPGEVAAICREVDVPLLGALPSSPALAAAGERGSAGWPADADLAAALAPLAGALWPLSLRAEPSASPMRLAMTRLGRALRRSS